MSASDYDLGRLDGQLHLLNEIEEKDLSSGDLKTLRQYLKGKQTFVYKLLDAMRIKANVPECSCHEKEND